MQCLPKLSLRLARKLLMLLVAAVWHWYNLNFGNLDYAQTMRWVIPGMLLTALGVQTVLSSFFISILGMKRKY